MKKEITIDGIRYVQAEEQEKINHTFYITPFRGAEVETDTSRFEFTVLEMDRETDQLSIPCIEYTNKITKQTEIWDNEIWLSSVLENKESDKELKELSNEDKSAIIQLLEVVKEKKWI